MADECKKPIDQDEPYRQIRFVAFFAVVVSTVAVVAAVVTLPLLYSQIQTLQSTLMNEMDFCKVSYKLISLFPLSSLLLAH